MQIRAQKHVRIKEVAKAIGVSYWTLTAWARNGLIEASKTAGGGHWVMTQAQVDKLVEQMGDRGDGPVEADA